ncbi:MAG: UTP--glucose-1-phosphate uridylyltransferase [Candidatus Berkelbacteria bacterium Gr01-1014_85]|uniref:UTP--glucose-1-phosphate uridylyltransferase n=1 Tax=Candidatus Berkelbacteria bacterium Gr01-1014_85 TaxID=2017150 RepID=A0A554JBX0_9BACT|nr:MAG: UTP--glucose-1-phosphate uridylyltransferase [Candidatus Berkelbacteria bacterium Gr01-1014_85]
MKIRKLVIPTAGFGTRMLPATKSIPKEMVPIVDRPVIHYLVESAVASGIEEIIFVNHPSKKAIEGYFQPQPDLEKRLSEAGKDELLAQIREINTMVKVSFCYQPEPLGNGHAILMARELVGDEPFVIVWGDDIFEGKTPHIAQLIEAYEQTGQSVLALVESRDEATFPDYCKRYACVAIDNETDRPLRVRGIVEKPAPAEAPSRYFSIGAYLFTPTIMALLAETKAGKSNEIWLADAVAKLIEIEPVFGQVIEGSYWDIGNKIGFVKANIHFALKNPETKAEIAEFIKGLNLE